MIKLSKFYKIHKDLGIVDTFNRTDKYSNLLNYPKSIELKTYGKSLDLLAYNLYGDTEFIFVLMDYNNIVNPFNIPETIFVVPNSELQKVLSD